MAKELTREALYQRIWSTPLKDLAVEWSTTSEIVKAACETAAIPRPGHGYWTLKEMGRTPAPTPLPPAPEGLVAPIVIAPRERRIVKRAAPAEVVVEPAQPPPQVATEAPAETAADSVPALAISAEPEIVRPTSPTTLTREALYEAVWRTPMSRLALTFGVSGNGLAKICDRASIPYPARGYWARLVAGRAPDRTPLPEGPGKTSSVKITIRPTPEPSPPVQLPPEIVEAARVVRASVSATPVPQRLVNPHPVIAKWLTVHEEAKRRSRLGEPAWAVRAFAPTSFTEQDRRKHRLLDALFKALDRNKVRVREDDRRVLSAEVLGEKIEFAVREKFKQGRRPLTDDEKRWQSAGDKDWRQELVNTGFFLLEIKRYLPMGFTRQWLETDAEPMETLIPDIVATIVSVGPLLVKERQAREEAERNRHLAELRRYEEGKRRKRDDNRWRQFTDFANDWRDLAAARAFLEALNAAATDPETDINGATLGEWLAWAEDLLKKADPLAEGVSGVFRHIATIDEWSYRD